MIFEIWMCWFYHTSNTINLVTATKYTSFWVIEYCVFVKDLIDCSATTHGVIFAKYVAQITKQQGRYAVGHRVLRFSGDSGRKRTRFRDDAERQSGMIPNSDPG